MIKMVQVAMFETSDGSRFETRLDAERYEIKDDLIRLAKEFVCYDMTAAEVAEELVARADRLREILKVP